MRAALFLLTAAAVSLGGCAMLSPGDRSLPPEPVMAPPPPPPPAPPPPSPSPDAGADMETGAAPDDLDRGLPICPGDPRCKKAGPG